MKKKIRKFMINLCSTSLLLVGGCSLLNYNSITTFAQIANDSNYYTLDGRPISDEEADKKLKAGEILAGSGKGSMSYEEYEQLVKEYENFDNKITTEVEANDVIVEKKKNDIVAAEDRLKDLELKHKKDSNFKNSDLYLNTKKS